MIGALLPDLLPYILGLVALLGAGLGIYAKGRTDGKAKEREKVIRNHITTRKEIDDALPPGRRNVPWHERLTRHRRGN